MRKFFAFTIALVMSVSMFAQTKTVEASEPWENISVSVEGGVLSPLNTNNSFLKDLRGTTGIELTKYVTPVYGFGVEALANFNTTGSYTIVDQSNVVLNGHLNVSNLLAGYKGYPRRVELEFIPGVGWGHNYGFAGYTDEELQTTMPFGETSYRNYLTYNAYGSLNFNMGKQRAWQINVRPGVTWATGSPNIGFYHNNAAVSVRAGLTYKFGSKSKKSHNFVLCPYSVTKADYDAVVAELNALKAREPEVRIAKEIVTKVDTVTTLISDGNGTLTVTFPIGKATLDNAQKELIETYATNADKNNAFVVAGSADSKTGSQGRNEFLAKERAKVVKDCLVEYGIPSEKITTTYTLDAYKEQTNSRSATVNIDR